LQASALALAGRIDEANVAAARLLALEPTFRIQPFSDFTAFIEPDVRATLVDGLRRAGLPE
jgi:hypothetical protein